MLEQLGRRVRELRLERNLTQAAAADAAKLDSTHWQAIERVRTNPTVATLVGVARALNIALSELFEGCENNPAKSPRSGRASDVAAPGRPPRSKPP